MSLYDYFRFMGHGISCGSLSWVTIGSLSCLIATRINSRIVWTIGTLLLLVATIKLMVFDFGSIAQIGNILAMILSGTVLMGLAWLPPIPPKKQYVHKDKNTRWLLVIVFFWWRWFSTLTSS